jgi:uncharacterized protein YPO0396
MDILKQKTAELTTLIAGLQNEKEHANNTSKSLDKQSNALTELTGFTDFPELDVQNAKRECLACEQRIEQLTKNEDNVLVALRDRRDKTESKKTRQEERLNEAKFKEHDVSKLLADVKQEHQRCIITLRSETALEKTAYPYLEKKRTPWLGNTVLTLDNSDVQEKRYLNRLSGEKSKLQGVIAELRTGIEKGMQHFMHEFPTETRETDNTISSLPDYRHMYDRLIRDDLPRYEKEFRDLLTSRVINQIALFQMTLKQQYDKVKERIKSINQSMHGIDYNPSRYIKLNCEDNPDNEIRLFRNQLKACTEGATGGFDDENLATERFLQIKEIIMRFQGREKEIEADKRWTKKVADVRNWFIFSASERWRETDEEYEHFAHSDGKSGGQKEKLAYTILAASLVYNYGLHEEYLERSTFRLVVIDEAFLRVSDNAAEYGLKLFEQLRFQLVIVTPLLKISTIEPFIAHVGFVSHDDVTHHSSLMNIPIEVYQDKRKAWENLQHG